jgi:hypothetical protein
MPGYILRFEYLMQSMVTSIGCYNSFLYFLDTLFLVLISVPRYLNSSTTSKL